MSEEAYKRNEAEKRDGGRFVKGRLEEGAQKKMVGG